MLCPNCGSDNVQISQVTETKNKLRVGAAVLIHPLALVVPKTKAKTKTQAVCQNCGWVFPPYQGITEVDPSKFDAAVAPSNPNDKDHRSLVDAAEALKKFKELLDMGAISQEEYDAKKAELLNVGNSHGFTPEPVNISRNASGTPTYGNVATPQRETERKSYSRIDTPIYGNKITSSTAEQYFEDEESDTTLRWKPASRPVFRGFGWFFSISSFFMFLLSVYTKIDPASNDEYGLLPVIAFFYFFLAAAFMFYSMLPKGTDTVKIKGWTCPIGKKWIFAILIALSILIFLVYSPSSPVKEDTSSTDVPGYTSVSDVVSNDTVEMN